MRFKKLGSALLLTVLFSCSKNDVQFFVNEYPASFKEVGSIDIGDVGAAEISAYDEITKRLFVVNNGTTNKIDVIDFSDPTNMKLIYSINISAYGAVNSVAAHDGKLAAAIEAINKQDAGRVVVYNTSTYSEIKAITVGALPDMITFSPDGKWILTANEGEPNTTYTNDPVGSVSIISVGGNYDVTNLDFGGFASQQAALTAKGLRVFGVGANFAKDMEPEYIAVAPDSKTAWVTLQENNAIAKINLASKTITDIFPLGFKDYNTDANAMDLSDKDGTVAFAKAQVKGIYMPDAIAVLPSGNIPYLFTANEGDAREYTALTEAKRIKDIVLDPTAFPNAATLKQEAQLGRLNITSTLGDIDGNGDYDGLYSFGARSFSVWNGNTGALVFDSKNELDNKCLQAGVYDDTRSDDKGAEPEGITIGIVGKKTIAFVGMERTDAVAIYDISDPTKPVYLQLLKTGDAPEGILFIAADKSPTKQSLLVASSENDGVIKVYMPNKL
ncbi:MAG TPA: choice-of-anchor I family protein [Phnomibacter sp.]|nr:choice-of-anchor I family protein [Phnomibacter sp.]